MERYNPADAAGKLFTDNEGSQWHITDATTKEIEANTGIKYHKNALLNEITTYNNLRRVERAVQYIDNLKQSPEFNRIAIKLGKANLPDGYKTTELPQLRGYAFPKRIAETFDTFYKKASSGLLDTESAYAAISRVMRNSIFFNPMIHIPNISVHWLVNRGASAWFDPRRYPDLASSGIRAIRDVLTMNEHYNEMLEKGTALQYSQTVNRNLYKVMLDKMGGELEHNPSLLKGIAKDLGMAPARLVKAIYNFSAKATWASNDIAVLQAIYEEVGHGKTFEQAIADTGKHIPTYRIPPRVMGSKTIANLMKPESGVTMFGAYHYGALKSYGEMIKSLIGKDAPLAERLDSVDKIAMLALTTYVLYPQLDKLAKAATGDKNAYLRRAGASTFPYKTEQLARGQIDFAQWVQSVLTPAVGFNAAIEAYYGRDPHTGQKTTVMKLAKGALAPISEATRISEGKKTLPKLGWGMIGVSFGKSPAEKEMSKRMPHIADYQPTEDSKEAKETILKALDLAKTDEEAGIDALYKAMDSGKITEKQFAQAWKEKDTPKFVRDFNKFGVTKTTTENGSFAALHIYKLMDAEQKAAVKDILNKKIADAWGKAAAAQRAELLKQWHSILPEEF